MSSGPKNASLELSGDDVPIYEYRCRRCGHETESFQRLADPPLTVSTNCGAEDLAKLVSAAGFRLKGGGWYETDFKTGEAKKNLAGASPETGKADSPVKTDSPTNTPAKPSSDG